MFNNTQNYDTQNNMWNDVIDFLEKGVKDAVGIKKDWDFYNENLRVLSNPDLFDVIRRIGRTEERYETEIKIYNGILAAKNAAFPPPPLSLHDQLMQAMNSPSPYQVPTYSDILRKHLNELSRLTEYMPYFVAMKYGKEKAIDWVLDKFGESVKDWFNRMNNQSGWY